MTEPAFAGPPAPPLRADAGDYARVAEAIRFLDAHYQHQPSLDDLARHLSLSPHHLQRLFARWAGISPKRFVQYLTVEHAKRLLAESHNVLETSLESGLSGPGRLHDLFVTVEAVTPGEFKSGGLGLEIAYGLHDTPFGRCLLAVTERGICALSFVDDGPDTAIAELRTRWPAAQIVEDPARTAPIHALIFGEKPGSEARPVHLLLKGTNFQLKVWEALLRVPPGQVTTYEEVARSLEAPNAARAVGAAVGANAIGFLIPCHRVIRKSGIVEGYRWGSTRKKAILGWESAHAERDSHAENVMKTA